MASAIGVSRPAERLFVGGRIPSLDGLRAIFIGMVIFAHLCGSRYFVNLVALRRDLGNVGVRVFFVISGFLITTLLLQEFAERGRVSLRLFYLRRSLRIFPCAYAYIAIACLLSLAGWLRLEPKDLIHAATYTVNYEQLRPWYTIHLWSLSVEEQFYFVWPVLLCIVGPRRGLWVAAGVLGLAPLTRLGTWYLAPELRWSIGASFQTNADALAAGCVLASIRTWLWARPGYLRFQRSLAFLALPLVALAAAILISFEQPPLLLASYAVGMTALNLAIALIIDRCVRHPGNLFGRLLNWKPIVFIGVLSYSLHLWQEPFLDRLSSRPINWFPINLILTFAAALVSYYVVEKPFLELRRRIERRLKACVALPITAPAPGVRRAADATN